MSFSLRSKSLILPFLRDFCSPGQKLLADSVFSYFT